VSAVPKAFADGLEPATTATTVDGQGEKAAGLDVALALATEGSKACRGTVEVRPFRTEKSVRALLEP
jgi:hypothetical protein